MLIKLAKMVCLDSKHLKEDGKNLKEIAEEASEIKKTVKEMQTDDSKEKK